MNRRDFLAKAGASVVSTGVADAFQETASAQPDGVRKSTSQKPNIIIMICDDLGYGDLACYGGTLKSPNLEAMANEGIRFSRCNSPHPTCSAARASLLTGQYASRVGVSHVFRPHDPGGMELNTPTIASVLQQQNYKTMAIGKWHLGQAGDYLPKGRGFDQFYGVPYSVDMVPFPLIVGTEIVEENTDRDTLTPRYTEQAIKFIESSRGEPFFLYLAFSYPHIPIHASSRFRGKSGRGIYGDSVAEIDWSVGEIRKALQRYGIEENTLLIFTSDHGPWYQGDPGRLRGRKDTDYEGGVRVPLLAAWKNHLPKGKVVDEFVSNMDLLPTVAALCQAPLPAGHIDGLDVWNLFAGKETHIDRGVVLYTSGTDFNIHCARLGDWKVRFASYNSPPYVRLGYPRVSCTLAHPELYHLTEDPTESYDVAHEHPQLVEKIMSLVESKIQTFPSNVQTAYNTQKSVVGNANMSAGALPVPLQA